MPLPSDDELAKQRTSNNQNNLDSQEHHFERDRFNYGWFRAEDLRRDVRVPEDSQYGTSIEGVSTWMTYNTIQVVMLTFG